MNKELTCYYTQVCFCTYRWSGLSPPIWTCTRSSSRPPKGENNDSSSRSGTWLSSESTQPSSPECMDHLGYLHKDHKPLTHCTIRAGVNLAVSLKVRASASQSERIEFYSREPSGSISTLDTCQWKCVSKKNQMSVSASKYFPLNPN